MQLVIRVDLDKTKQRLPEIFRLLGNCGADEASEGASAGAGASIKDDRSQVIGEWEIEESEESRHAIASESSYRAAAAARYARPGQIEVDRFATVSSTGDGAYVQGWLFVPRTDIASGAQQPEIARKPPKSVLPIENTDRKTG